MPHRINSLCFALLSLCLGAQIAWAQTPSSRPATGSTRPPAKKSSIPATEEAVPRSTLPRIAREPAGRAGIHDEPAETTDPGIAPIQAGPRQFGPQQRAMQGPAPRQLVAEDGEKPQVIFKPISEEMKAVLLDWENNTKNITSLSCPITRFEFDIVFATETRSVGKVYFQNPDMGRIDFSPADKTLLAKTAGRVDEQGRPFKVIAGPESKWICTGKKIYILDMLSKQYDTVEIPPQNQGQNISRSPLPFIFGMKAEDAMRRFHMKFGEFHNPDGTLVDKTGKKLRPGIHIVANPKLLNEAKEYREAHVILDPATFLPMNLRTIDPAGNKETVYSFDQSALKVGVKWGLTNPFRDPILPGWTEMKHGNADPQPPIRQTQNTMK